MRGGVKELALLSTTMPDAVRGTTTGLMLDNLAIQVDSRKAEGLKFKFNLIQPDINEKFVVEMSNATLTHISGYEAKDANLTIMINRGDLEDIMLGKTKLEELVKAGRARLDGDAGVLKQLASAVEAYDPLFEIMPGTKPKVQKPKAKEEVLRDDAPRTHEP